MPLSYRVQVLQPIPVTIQQADGSEVTYNLPYLGTKGLLPWLDERAAERKKAGRDALAKCNLVPIDRFQAERAIELDKTILADLVPPAQTPAGIERIIKLSIEQSDVPKDQRQTVLDTILSIAYIAANLSRDLCTLFRQDEPVPAVAPTLPGGQQDPLAGRGSEIPDTSTPAPTTIS